MSNFNESKDSMNQCCCSAGIHALNSHRMSAIESISVATSETFISNAIQLQYMRNTLAPLSFHNNFTLLSIYKWNNVHNIESCVCGMNLIVL